MIRKGQQAFNDLYRTHPDIADKIRGTVLDPFYDDSKLEAFRQRVAELLVEKWNNGQIR